MNPTNPQPSERVGELDSVEEFLSHADVDFGYACGNLNMDTTPESRSKLISGLNHLITRRMQAFAGKIQDYGSWLEPKCDLHEKYTSACCGCQKAHAVYYAINDYKDYVSHFLQAEVGQKQ